MFNKVFGAGVDLAVSTAWLACVTFSPALPAAGPAVALPPEDKPVITVFKPEGVAGRGYRLEYTVDVPLEIAWQFKTDFKSKIVLTNPMVLSHRLVSRNGNVVVTESVQKNKPKSVFRWKTTLFPDQHRIAFVLLDPDQCGMDHLYGSIRLQAIGSATRITQVAYLDFFGVTLWVNYPFRGGMSQTLFDTVRWEQQAVLAYRQSLGHTGP